MLPAQPLCPQLLHPGRPSSPLRLLRGALHLSAMPGLSSLCFLSLALKGGASGLAYKIPPNMQRTA